MERRGVVEKSRGLQVGRTDERITPELFLLWPRCSAAPTRQSLASRKAGRPGPGLGIGPRPGLGLGFPSQGCRPAGERAGWAMEVGRMGCRSWLEAGRLDVGRWRGLSLAAVGSMRPKTQLQEAGSLRGGQVGRLAPGSKGSRGLLWGIDQCSSGRCAVTAFLACLCLALVLPASGRRTRQPWASRAGWQEADRE